MNKAFIIIILSLFAASAKSEADRDIAHFKNKDNSEWVLEFKKGGSEIKYTNSNGYVYTNNSVISSDVDASGLFLDQKDNGVASFTVAYPRDTYSFDFSSGNTPVLISACKQTLLPQINNEQAAVVLVLCSKGLDKKNIILPKVKIEEIFKPNNLTLTEHPQVLITSDRSFLYNENSEKMKNKPYLIKGDIVELLEYNNSMLKIKYLSKRKEIIAWIKFSDIL